MTDEEFAEVKKRFPHYVTEDDRPLDFPALIRMVEDRIDDDLKQVEQNRARIHRSV